MKKTGYDNQRSCETVQETEERLILQKKKKKKQSPARD